MLRCCRCGLFCDHVLRPPQYVRLLGAGAFLFFWLVAEYMLGYFDGRERGIRIGIEATISEVERITSAAK